MTNWEATSDPRIQVRLRRESLAALKLGVYLTSYQQFGKQIGSGGEERDRLPPFEPDHNGEYPLGYEVRVKPELPPVRDGKIRCTECNRVVAIVKNTGKPWKHACDPTATDWQVIRRLSPTRQKAYARGLYHLGELPDTQQVWNVGNGKRSTA